MNYLYKSFLQFCLWYEKPLKFVKSLHNVQDCSLVSSELIELTIQKFRLGEVTCRPDRNVSTFRHSSSKLYPQ